MACKRGTDRKQTVLFPESLDEYVAADSPVRLIDAFADSLDMIALGFHRVEPDGMGRPAYDPRVLLKVLIYGYFYGARSSRRMERECKVNVEVMWLIGKLTPDHNTLSEFRKGNIRCMKPMFREFNRFCLRMDMFRLDYVSIDGSKFRAVNSKDRNFTLSKLDDRLKRLDAHIDEYLVALEESDGEDVRKLSRREVEEKEKLAASILSPPPSHILSMNMTAWFLVIATPTSGKSGRHIQRHLRPLFISLPKPAIKESARF